MPTVVHKTAIMDPSVQLGEDVFIGPYSIIGPNSIIGDRTQINPHVLIRGNTTIGHDCRIYQFCSLGESAQISALSKKEQAEGQVLIGSHNTIREYTSIHAGSKKGDYFTRVGDYNEIHAFTNIGHDCFIHNHTVISAAALAGHVEVFDHAFLGGYCRIHQHVRVGPYAFLGGASAAVRDVTPYMITAPTGGVIKTLMPNVKGLERKGFFSESIKLLGMANRLVRKTSSHQKLIESLEALYLEHQDEHLRIMIDFMSVESIRGYIR